MTSKVGSFLRKCVCSVLSAGPTPRHIAFIMDGNRRYARKKNLEEGTGHGVGFSALTKMLRYCYELGVNSVTVYAFSIDNFKRSPGEVQSLMHLMQQKMEELLEQESVVNQYGFRVHFAGNLKLLTEPVKEAAERVMEATANNARAVLSICVAYTSTDEITHAIQEIWEEKTDGVQAPNADEMFYDIENQQLINLADSGIEKHMYTTVAPDPDIIIRTSGETRLSNFLLWQSASCLLYSPVVLWPEIGFRHLVWAILEFQRNHSYLEKKKKKLQQR